MNRLILGLLVALLSFQSTGRAQAYGHYTGTVVTEWLDDGRRMKLTERFSYEDPSGAVWDAPAGSIIDGASIPRLAWSVIGGPFEGMYRDASVIHDVACQQRTRPWRYVHLAFYYAMLASGVDPTKADIMYMSVYTFGPKWGDSVADAFALDSADLPGATAPERKPDLFTPQRPSLRGLGKNSDSIGKSQTPTPISPEDRFNKLKNIIETEASRGHILTPDEIVAMIISTIN
jgi:hypothetical protein